MKFDIIVIGGGVAGTAKAVECAREGLKVAMICKGRSLYGLDHKEFLSLGGTVLMDTATKGFVGNGKATAVRTEKLESDLLYADRFYLATGKYFAGGLCTTMDSVYEPVFGIDVRFESDRSKWFDPDFHAAQPFMSFGAITDENGNATIGGAAVTNLFPIGEIKAE